jgi:glycosyltransferase involved in cell wall biosynthesis
MPTFNRYPKAAHLVAEAVESFLRQDYPDKELIIFNDTPGQTLELDQPYRDVVVVNSPRRYKTLGEKLNAAFGIATGDFLCRFDDDDLSLPWRLSLSVERCEGLAYWSSKEFFYMNGDSCRVSRSGAPSKSIWSREVFDDVGGFPHVDSGQDQDFQALCKRQHPAHYRYEAIKPEEVFYVYRWGTGTPHLSGYGRGSKGYKAIGDREIARGTFTIEPGWLADYETEIRKAAESD